MWKAAWVAVVGSVVVCAIAAATDDPPDDKQLQASAERATKNGLAFLAKQQAADGGWHSATYGQLKAGPGVTSLILYSFSRCPRELRKPHSDIIARGYRFFQPGLQKKGTLAASDGSLDYPTYACALWLLGRARHELPAAAAEHRQVVEYLLAAQLLEPRGFRPDSSSYGGWDFLGLGDAQGITTGTNVSLAAYILEALSDENLENLDQARPRAARGHAVAWLERTQQPDGGFAFSPEPASLNNKALFLDEAQARPRSYGTATCDGVRALVAAGVKSDDERVQRAVKWLVERPSLEVVPGFETLPPEIGWQRGLRFYYYASLAEALRHFPPAARGARRRALLETLVKQQRADGGWINESARMREDDPLIATSFAIAALGALLEDLE